MTALGKQTRLNRIFRHPSRRILAVAVDHLINYPDGIPFGLRTLGDTIRRVAESEPSSITLNKGAAIRYLPDFAGRVPFIIQSMALRPHLKEFASPATAEECVALGADAIAVAMFVKGPHEMQYVHHLAAVVRDAERVGLPVIPHVYPVSSGDERTSVTHNAEDVYYAVRIALECGADVIKVPYTGDVASFREIVSLTPVPVVTAGGPTCKSLDEAAAMVRDIAASGAAGVTIGRNVWGFPDIPAAVARLKDALYGG